MNRVQLVYKELGRVLNSPQSFGLGDRPPKPLIEALSTMLRCLRQEMAEQNEMSSGDWLSSELSQDADRPHQVKTASVTKKTW